MRRQLTHTQTETASFVCHLEWYRACWPLSLQGAPECACPSMSISAVDDIEVIAVDGAA